ncbi:MAG: NUDIX domain-containing protein [Chloroflexota bacterium]|nr:NUDIX domain-containing protein [Chloroflexota bacterium]
MQSNGEELLEVVDEEGRFVRLATRAECHSNRSLIHRSVCILLFDSGGRLFLQRRSRYKDLYAGMTDVSVAGHARPGEGWEEAARHELGEELGIEVGLEPIRIILVPVPLETELTAIFRAEYDGPMQLDPSEVESGDWYTWAEAMQVPDLTPYAAAILDDLSNNQK